MAGRPRKFDEEEVLQKAIDVFWEKGYESASSEDLLKAMNMGKGSFYLQFKRGKEELFERCMEFRAKQSLSNLQNKLNKAEDKISVIKNLFLERLHTQEYFKNYGCLLGNTVVEMANLNEALKDKAALYLKQLEDVFKEVVSEAIKTGKLHTAKSPEFIAKYLINIWNGMNITKRMHSGNDLLIEVVSQNLKILD